MAITPKQIKNTINMVKKLFSSGEQQVAQNLDNPHSLDNLSFDDVSEDFLQLYPQNTPPTDIPTINNPIPGGSPIQQFNVPPPLSNFHLEPSIHLPPIPPLKTNDSFIPFSGFNPTVSNFDNATFNNSPPLIFNVSDPSQPPQAFPGKEALDESSNLIKNLISPLDNNQAPPTHPISIPELTVTPSPITTTPQPTPVAELPLKAPETTPAVTQPVSQPIMSPEVSSNPVIQANKGSDVTSNMVDNYMNSTRGQQKIEQNKQQRAQQQEQQRQALITQQQKEQEAIAAKENLAKTRQEAYEKRKQTNPVFAALDNMNNIEKGDQDNVAYQAFRESFQTGGTGNKRKQQDMLREELLGANRNNNPETVNQRIDFYRNQGAINDEQAEPLKAFFNTNFENMDEEGVKGWFNQYRNNLKGGKMTPRQARLSVNQQMDNKREGFFSAGSKENFKNFAGRALVGGAFGAAIGTATDDNPEAGFVAGVVGATAGKNIAGMLRNNTDMFEGKMINSLLKDTAKGKTRAQQLEAVDDLDDEALDFMDKMYKDKLTNNFGTANMFESSALTSSRNMTLGGAALAGVAFTPKKRDHRRGFNANRGNRI